MSKYHYLVPMAFVICALLGCSEKSSQQSDSTVNKNELSLSKSETLSTNDSSDEISHSGEEHDNLDNQWSTHQHKEFESFKDEIEQLKKTNPKLAQAQWRQFLIETNIFDTSNDYDLVTDSDSPSLKDKYPEIAKQAMALKIQDILRLRKEYGYKSLHERLAYEDQSQTLVEPQLSISQLNHLDEMEELYGRSSGVRRAESLRLLHHEEVEKFIARDGFGVSRITPPGRSYIELPAPFAQIPFASLPASSSVETTAKDSSPRPPYGKLDKALRLPSEDILSKFNLMTSIEFSNPFGFGHVIDRDRVAGFREHGFYGMPKWEEMAWFNHAKKKLWNGPEKHAQEQKKDRWDITRLELVSLLKQKEPRVYVSKHLPSMVELSSAKTRPLTEMEVQGLVQLQQGKDVATHASVNRITMLGSLRAIKQCQQCHDVKRGVLLGAFSYELRRNPPIVDLAKQKLGKVTVLR